MIFCPTWDPSRRRWRLTSFTYGQATMHWHGHGLCRAFFAPSGMWKEGCSGIAAAYGHQSMPASTQARRPLGTGNVRISHALACEAATTALVRNRAHRLPTTTLSAPSHKVQTLQIPRVRVCRWQYITLDRRFTS